MGRQESPQLIERKKEDTGWYWCSRNK